jgi:DNA-binding transcriptional LysR family regulator
MDIQDMRIFARVAAVQNLSAVGTELGLTPGTISKRIQALEDEFRPPLRPHDALHPHHRGG